MIKQAVTPAFSRDGKMVAFNYWQGTLAPGGGNGHTLDIMDFAAARPATPVLTAPSCELRVLEPATHLHQRRQPATASRLARVAPRLERHRVPQHHPTIGLGTHFHLDEARPRSGSSTFLQRRALARRSR